MQKLIIDEEAMKLACSKLSGQPIYGGQNGKFVSTQVIDVLDENDDGNKWQPGNEGSQLLVLAREACRDLIFQAERFEEQFPHNRVIKCMTVPLCSLMDNINKLIHNLNDDESKKIRENWPHHDQEMYKEIGRKLRKKHLKGSIRKVRNKIGAHLDPDIFLNRETKISLKDFLCAMGDSLILTNLVINHPRQFCWIRWIGSGSYQQEDIHLVETFFEFPICVRWVTDTEGRVIDVGYIQLAEDPRFYIRQDVMRAIKVYNSLVDKSKLSSSQVRKIWNLPSDNLKTIEQKREQLRDQG